MQELIEKYENDKEMLDAISACEESDKKMKLYLSNSDMWYIGKDGNGLGGLFIYGPENILEEIFFQVADNHELGEHLNSEAKTIQETDLKRWFELASKEDSYSWMKITFDNYQKAENRPTIAEGKILQYLLVSLAQEKEVKYKLLIKN